MAKAKRAAKKVYFPPQIAIRKDNDNGEDLFIVGDPADPAGIDANHGDKVAVYELKEVCVFQTQARLEAQ